MTLKEKRKLCNNLIGNVKKDILSQLERLPDDWDGIELRYLIRDHFDLIVFAGYEDQRCKRYREYKNFAICNNLP